MSSSLAAASPVLCRCFLTPSSTSHHFYRHRQHSLPSNSSSAPDSAGGQNQNTNLGGGIACARSDGRRNDVNSSSSSSSLSRRGLLFMTSLPLLFPHRAGAQLEDIDSIAIIQAELRKVLSKVKAAGVLRLAFHDAGTFDVNASTGGMNGSIIYELDKPENAGLDRPVKVLSKAKIEVDKAIEVSWADMIALGGAEAVSICGGPIIPIKTGRIDAREPDPEGKLPLESLDAPALKRCFLEKGLSTQELVALSGAHSIGNKGFGNPYIFDNSYYNILLDKPWTSLGGMSSMIGLPSDRALVEDDECLRWIRVYAADQDKFFNDFSCAYIKLVNCGAIWKSY